MKGIVYTQTIVHSAPEAYVADAPYQLVIVTIEDGSRVTGRIVGDVVAIGDNVALAEDRGGTPYFRKV